MNFLSLFQVREEHTMKNNTDTIRTIRNSGRASVAGSILALTLAIIGFILLKNAGHDH